MCLCLLDEVCVSSLIVFSRVYGTCVGVCLCVYVYVSGIRTTSVYCRGVNFLILCKCACVFVCVCICACVASRVAPGLFFRMYTCVCMCAYMCACACACVLHILSLSRPVE